VQNDLSAADTRGACGDLNGYLNHVGAQSGKQLSASLATTLTANANRIRAVLSC
jgi:hypothetical protein